MISLSSYVWISPYFVLLSKYQCTKARTVLVPIPILVEAAKSSIITMSPPQTLLTWFSGSPHPNPDMLVVTPSGGGQKQHHYNITASKATYLIFFIAWCIRFLSYVSSIHKLEILYLPVLMAWSIAPKCIVGNSLGFWILWSPDGSWYLSVASDTWGYNVLPLIRDGLATWSLSPSDISIGIPWMTKAFPSFLPGQWLPSLLQHTDSTVCIVDTLDCPVLFYLTYRCFTLHWLLFYVQYLSILLQYITLCPTPLPHYYIRDTLHPTTLVYKLYY